MAPRWRQGFGLAAFNLLRTQQLSWLFEVVCGCVKDFLHVFFLYFALFDLCFFLVIATVKPECQSKLIFCEQVHSITVAISRHI